jgi:hypothetical protein
MIIPRCFHCSHKVKGRLKCAAFGEGLIPEEILFGFNDHSNPLEGQKNLLIFDSTQLVMLVTDYESPHV